MKSSSKELSINFFRDLVIGCIFFDVVIHFLAKNKGENPPIFGLFSMVVIAINTFFYFRRKKIPIDISEDEIILYGYVSLKNSTLFSQKFGWLYLTNSQLIFSFVKSGTNSVLKFNLLDLTTLELATSTGSSEILLQITNKNNVTNKFKVAEPTVWEKTIRQAMNKSKKSQSPNLKVS